MPSSWRAWSGRPWCPDWVIRAMAGPSRSSRNRSKAFRLVFGPSSRSPDRSTAAASRAWAAAPASPVSANPEAKATAKGTLASPSSSITGSGSATSSTARSTGSGSSATEGTHARPNTAARVGCTGWSRAPTRSAQATSCRVMPVLGRPSASDAPTTATERGRKKRSRSGTGRCNGRPLTSRPPGAEAAGRLTTAACGSSPQATTRARKSVVRVP